jgi:hypothetical protein
MVPGHLELIVYIINPVPNAMAAFKPASSKSHPRRKSVRQNQGVLFSPYRPSLNRTDTPYASFQP